MKKEAVLAVDVVNKDDESVNTCSGVRFVSGVTSAGSGVPCNAGSSHAGVNGQGSNGGTGNGQGSAAHGNGQGSAAPDITQGLIMLKALVTLAAVLLLLCHLNKHNQ